MAPALFARGISDSWDCKDIVCLRYVVTNRSQLADISGNSTCLQSQTVLTVMYNYCSQPGRAFSLSLSSSSSSSLSVR